MSNKIDSALKDLIKALKKHADVASDRHPSLKRSQRATARVHAAAEAYASAVNARSGLSSPFADVIDPTLDDETLASLSAERDQIKQSLTAPVPLQQPAK